MSNFLAPPEISTTFYPDGIDQEKVLVGGSVNTTLLITAADQQRTILQRLSPIFNESMAEDFDIVSNHLWAEGWEVPEAVRSTDGIAYVPDETGSLWRSFSYIESDGRVPEADSVSVIALSGLLGSLHDSLSRLDYIPRFQLPNFHETTYYADKLEGMLSQLVNPEARHLGAKAIRLARSQAIDQEPVQLIHGDPKMANALYRDGAPFTFIDFDTLMKANPLIDVGDMIRSVAGKLAGKNPDFKLRDMEPVIGAYYEAAKPLSNETAFMRLALNAGQVITLELGIRYLIDSVEGAYFDWDKETFASSTEQNIAKAHAQWQTYEVLQG